ncbi:MAG: polymer-forming cytoskeletal protein [Balneolales bacterium]
MKNDTPGQPNINIISAGTVLSGTLQSKSDLRISGTIDGHVHAESKCVLSESGLLKGDLATKDADIAGTVEGEILISNRLILRSTAKVTGDIKTKILMVEEGASIDGACKMSDKIDLSKEMNKNGMAQKSGSSSDKQTADLSSTGNN